MVDGRDTRYVENNDTLHFNQITDEEKGCRAVVTTHAVSHAKTLYGTVSDIFDSLQKGRNCVFTMNNHYFVTNNHYWWNLSALLWTWTEISERGLEGKKNHRVHINFTAKLWRWNKWWKWLKPGTHLLTKWFANRLQTVHEPNRCMSG